MNKFRIILFWLLVSGYTLLSLSFSSIKSSQIKCQEIIVKVKDNTKHLFVESKDIIELFGKKGIQIINQNIYELDVNKLEKLIEEIPSIKSAQVYTNIDGKLTVEIVQRNPILRIINSANESFYIDESGEIMPLSKNYTAHVLVANGEIDQLHKSLNNKNISEIKKEENNIITELYIIADFINKSPFWKAQIEQIFVTKKGEFELIPRIGMHVIIFGNSDNYYEKFQKLELLYKKGLPQKGWNRYKSINLKYKNQIVCTKN
ncbi:MAG: FtsQ-type POTRA domain-containing protein [Bacteroidales bacterium]|nr:FtsQ-type POTRA domain-containing protein [Bacteroidales bacterium]